MVENERIVTSFSKSWERGTEGIDRYLAEDVFYWNVPLAPIHGREATRSFVEPLIGTAANWLERVDILHTASAGDVVMNERLEIWAKADLRVELPVMGIFELRGGRIVSWRDYFDLPTLQPILDAVAEGR